MHSVIFFQLPDLGKQQNGKEVTILWGDRDKYPIKKIRAMVGPFPSTAPAGNLSIADFHHGSILVSSLSG